MPNPYSKRGGDSGAQEAYVSTGLPIQNCANGDFVETSYPGRREGRAGDQYREWRTSHLVDRDAKRLWRKVLIANVSVRTSPDQRVYLHVDNHFVARHSSKNKPRGRSARVRRITGKQCTRQAKFMGALEVPGRV
ncbi:hypothetical protein BZA77DRAFT_295400 [Pyronema omphalodes]|nr:hypothetical protein BZA77DRAFT_295400 [Pyronema omphalodes]